MEIDLTSLGIWAKDIMIIIGVPMIRSVAGWAEKALQDHKITKFEWKKLSQTIVRVGLIGIMGYYGLTIAGVDQAALAAAVAAFFADKLFGSLKENKPVRG